MFYELWIKHLNNMLFIEINLKIQMDFYENWVNILLFFFSQNEKSWDLK